MANRNTLTLSDQYNSITIEPANFEEVRLAHDGTVLRVVIDGENLGFEEV